jgi:hypothetical protein
MGHRKFWAEDTDTHGRWGEYRHARAAERGTRVDRGPDPDDRSPRAELPSGGYQRPDVEGRRAYSPGERGARSMRAGSAGCPRVRPRRSPPPSTRSASWTASTGIIVAAVPRAGGAPTRGSRRRSTSG